MSKDPYKTLGVDRDASMEDIKKAYRKKAKECHPDANPDDPQAEEKFKELSEAYSILSNPQKKQQFDMGGMSGQGFSGGMNYQHIDLSEAMEMFAQAFGGGGMGGDPFDMMSGIFGNRTQQRRQSARDRKRRGRDLRISVSLTLEEIFTGVSKTIKVKRKKVCPQCSGAGVPEGAKVRTCPTCQGRGQVKQVRRSILGSSVTITPCPDCGGSGNKYDEICSHCSGTGRIQGQETIKVDIPAGVAEGNYLTVEGKGDSGIAGGPPGNLIVFIREKPHKKFHRRGEDLFTRIPISFSQAALGDTIDIKTIDNKTAKLKIPQGTQFGQALRLKKLGLPKLHSKTRGDLIVTVFVRTPENLNKQEKELFQKLGKFDSKHKSEHEKEDLFDRFRDVLD